MNADAPQAVLDAAHAHDTALYGVQPRRNFNYPKFFIFNFRFT